MPSSFILPLSLKTLQIMWMLGLIPGLYRSMFIYLILLPVSAIYSTESCKLNARYGGYAKISYSGTKHFKKIDRGNAITHVRMHHQRFWRLKESQLSSPMVLWKLQQRIFIQGASLEREASVQCSRYSHIYSRICTVTNVWLRSNLLEQLANTSMHWDDVTFSRLLLDQLSMVHAWSMAMIHVLWEIPDSVFRWISRECYQTVRKSQ